VWLAVPRYGPVWEMTFMVCHHRRLVGAYTYKMMTGGKGLCLRCRRVRLILGCRLGKR
jgi:hypothetical protein